MAYRNRASNTRTIKPVADQASDMIQERASKMGKPGPNIYAGSTSETDARLSETVARRANTLIPGKRSTRVDFNDMDDVEQRTYDYLQACVKASMYPTSLGLATHGYGLSRQALYYHLNTYPEAPESQYIRMVLDVFADILVNDSLRMRCNVIAAIFAMKNLYGFQDTGDTLITTESTQEEDTSLQALREKYGYLIPE